MKKISLVHLRSGQRRNVVEISGGAAVEDRLMRMGIYPGSPITKISHFRLHGPVTVKTGRTTVALGHGMAHKVFVDNDS